MFTHLVLFSQMRYTENRPYQGYQKGEQEMTEKDAKKLAGMVSSPYLSCLCSILNTSYRTTADHRYYTPQVLCQGWNRVGSSCN